MLEARIRKGDYAARDLPTERELADEVGVSRMTARRALLELMDKGLLVRKPRGRIAINHDYANTADQLRIAFLGPAFSSADFEAWRFAVHRSSSKFNAIVRNIDYVHWNDPIVPQTLAAFDGVFLVMSAEPLPDAVLEWFGRARNLVVVGSDLADHGVPSVRMLPPNCVQQLADHLYALGHRKIDCLNVQPHDYGIRPRLEHWSLWQRLHKVDGRLIDDPVQHGTFTAPKAHAVMKRLLDAGQFDATGLVCITDDAAIGAIRALYDAGLKIGTDVSVCSVEAGVFGALHIPSRTMLSPPEPGPYLEACFDWFSRRGEAWAGPLLLEPANIPLFQGESTGPAPATTKVQHGGR